MAFHSGETRTNAAPTGLLHSLIPAATQMLKKSAETPKQKPQANKPYGTKERTDKSYFIDDMREGYTCEHFLTARNTPFFNQYL